MPKALVYMKTPVCNAPSVNGDIYIYIYIYIYMHIYILYILYIYIIYIYIYNYKGIQERIQNFE